MTDKPDPLERLSEPRPLAEMLNDLEDVDLSEWSEPIDLSEFRDPLDLSLDAPARPRKRRQPGARQAAAVLDRIVTETSRSRHPSSRFDSARIADALTVAAAALRSGEDWRQAVAEVYNTE